MAPRQGSVGFLWLSESFGPRRWREALVIGVKDSWVQTVVKATAEEIAASGLASIEVEGKHFCLVEARASQVRLGPSAEGEDVVLLETDKKALARAAETLLSSEEELVYATASEPVQLEPAKTSKQKGHRDPSLSSSSSASGSSSEEEDPVSLMRKKWLGEDTGKEKKSKDRRKSSRRRRSHSRRFALISKSRGRKKSREERTVQEELLKAVSSSKDPLQGLLALQIAQSMGKEKKDKKGRRRRAKDRSASSSRSSSSSTSSSSSKARGHARAVENMEANRKKMFKHPIRYVKKYMKSIEKEMGAEDRAFRVTDYTRRINFGKQRNLARCHHLFGIVLEMLLREDYAEAALQVTLCLQALHQAAIDSDWTVAWLLTCTQDPYEKKQWGGDATALQHVTAYVRSMQDLSKSSEQLRRKSQHREEDAEEEKPRNRPKRKGKSKTKEAEKTEA